MYKLLLCWRYLRTRYLALVCTVSVMLGVATLIVVNSVMSGFSTKMKERLRGAISDVVLESATQLNGFADPQAKMALIRNDPILGPRVAAMTATQEIFAMLQYEYQGMTYTRPIRLIGIDPVSRSQVAGFQEYLTNPMHRADPSKAFKLDQEALRHFQFNHWQPGPLLLDNTLPPMRMPGVKPPPEPPEWADKPHVPRGCILGYAIAHYRVPSSDPSNPVEERQTRREGDTVVITTVSGAKLAPACDRFVVAGFCKTEMSEYDSSYVYVPLDHLQHLRAMDDRVTAIHIKLHDYSEAKVVVDRLKKLFDPDWYEVQTWEHKQGPLLAAISIEKSLLNVLLFLIVAVAGFGILAIFSMIVVEKTRDIGILKALGASNFGVMKIFLSYGLLLGLVGAVLGTGLGLLITNNLNSIEKFLTKATGMEVFPRDIYYFSEIPTDVQPMTVFLVNAGAVLIAVLFSILPALRAASLHPVKALRYE